MGAHQVTACQVLTMRPALLITLSSLALASTAGAEEVDIQSSRNPKIFLVSTTTSTSTYSAMSVCWIQFSTVNGIITCSKKRRSINFLEELGVRPAEGPIAPHPALKVGEEDLFDDPSEITDVTGGKNDEDDIDDRELRQLNYWMTRIVTTTYTTFTATSSIGSLYCTPLGYTDVPCPANG